MGTKLDRRRWHREVLKSQEVGFYMKNRGHESESSGEELPATLFVDILNRSEGGVRLRSIQKMKPKALFHLQIYNCLEKLWVFYQGKVIWIGQGSTKSGNYLIGVEIERQHYETMPPEHEEKRGKQMPLPSDYEFFRGTTLFRFISQDAVCPLLNNMTCKHMKAGERLISQGEVGDAFFLIQRGSCVINVEKDRELRPIANLREGDIVGEMALLTGEPRNAHVYAETDMKLWVLSAAKFNDICEQYPEVRSFLTEIVTDRFDSSTLTADRKIGKYVITDIIGHGGYSVVYKGIHEDLNMPVVIKMMKHNLAMDPDFRYNFRNEAKLIAKFNHENIVRVYDIEKLYRTVFIIMEHLKGETLEEMLERLAIIPLPRVTDFLIQICYGLGYAHQQGIIHQDIKPANIFVLEEDRLKILDFGIACPIGTENLDFSGTVAYMAPEQIELEAVDQRTDIYSVGIVAYEMVTGKRPYPEDDLLALEDMHVNKDIPDPAQAAPDLPEELRRFILKACSRDPGQRYHDVGQAMEDLQPLFQKFGLTRKDRSSEKRKMTTLFLIYKDEHQLALNKLMEDFGAKAQGLGVVLKAADIKDV